MRALGQPGRARCDELARRSAHDDGRDLGVGAVALQEAEDGIAAVGAADGELVYGAAMRSRDERPVGSAIGATLEHGHGARTVHLNLPGSGQGAVRGAREHRVARHFRAGVQPHGRTDGCFRAARVKALDARAVADVEAAPLSTAMLIVPEPAAGPSAPAGPSTALAAPNAAPWGSNEEGISASNTRAWEKPEPGAGSWRQATAP